MSTLMIGAATSEMALDAASLATGRMLEAPLRAGAFVIVHDQTPFCMISCDVIALTRDLVDEIGAGVAGACGIPADNLLVTSTHTHHAPGTLPIYLNPRNEAFAQRTVAAAVDAARKAMAAANENGGQAELLHATGQEATVGGNSRWLTQEGQITWSGHDESVMVRPTGPHDPDLPVLAARDASGRFLGAVFGHGTHNIGTLGDYRQVFSPGFFGLAAQELERQHGAPCLFLPGAFGSSHRRDSAVAAPEAVHRVVAAVNEALAEARPVVLGPVVSVKQPFVCQHRHFDEAEAAAEVSGWCRRWHDATRAESLEQTYASVRQLMAPKMGREFETQLHAIRLGEVAILGIPGEMFARLGLRIRHRSPFRHTIVVGLANDEIGYIPDREGYVLGGYQTWVCEHSKLAPGTGEAMVDAAVALLHDIHG
ncbi:MAG: hypothetical protein HN849_32955 [Victivallales bacterium]|nr:hypothetical protein [Victivallales bacterium]